MLKAIAAVGLVALTAGIMSGQAQRSPATLDDLAAEVRGLRADVNQASGASVRAQLLVARLQLQEQRINTAVKQLAELRERRTGRLVELERLREAVQRFADAVRRNDAPTVEDQTAVESMLKESKAELSRVERADQSARAQEAELVAMLASEESRWIDLSSRLDELERTLPPR